MDENGKREYAELLDKDPMKSLSDFSHKIKTKQEPWINDMLSIIEEKSKCVSDVKHYREGRDKSESLLHVAVKYEEDLEIIQRIINFCPDLLMLARESFDNYRGQTPLHIAITKGHCRLTKLLLDASANQKKSSKKSAKRTLGLRLNETPTQTHSATFTMIHTKATGRIFSNTVMMAELPLSVAALTFNESIIDLLIHYGADIHSKNSSGDTVLHSLVRYAAVYPDRTDKVISMLNYFISKFEEDISHPFHAQDYTDPDIRLRKHSYAWFAENKDRLTPLQLSAKLSVVEIFQFIINLENVYTFVSDHDGLFDIKLYDITEFDTLAKLYGGKGAVCNEGNSQVLRNTDGETSRKNITKYPGCTPLSCSKLNNPPKESILEMLFAYGFKNESAFRIMETIPVKNIVMEKWGKIRFLYYIWGIIHLFITICFTADAVIRSDLYTSSLKIRVDVLPNYYYSNAEPTYETVGKVVSVSAERFADIIFYVNFLIGGLLYGCLVTILLVAKIRKQNALRYIFHNLFNFSCISIFSLSLIIDFAITQSGYHYRIALVIALITGWLFVTFFLRAIFMFGYFMEMIMKVIFGDLLRFLVLSSIILISFTAGIYISFIGKSNFESYFDFSSYSYNVQYTLNGYDGTMFKMFRLMLGMDSINDLNEANLPWLATILYIIFTLLTYVFLLSSLIAMMSKTCAGLWENRYPLWRLHQLSVILFIEDLFCLPCIRARFKLPTEKRIVTVFDPETKQKKEVDRFYLKVHSLETTYANEEDREALRRAKLDEKHSRLDSILLNTKSGSFFRSESKSHGYTRKPSRAKGKGRETKIDVDSDPVNKKSKQTYTSYHSDASIDSIPEPVE